MLMMFKSISEIMTNGLILLTLMTFMIGCTYTNDSINNDNKKIPELKVFAKVEAAVLIKSIDAKTADVEIKNIDNYEPLESKETLLGVGDNIKIYFTGVGDEKDWRTRLISVNDSIKLSIRCIDGRVNSLDKFTKISCYWEANEKEINLI